MLPICAPDIYEKLKFAPGMIGGSDGKVEAVIYSCIPPVNPYGKGDIIGAKGIGIAPNWPCDIAIFVSKPGPII